MKNQLIHYASELSPKTLNQLHKKLEDIDAKIAIIEKQKKAIKYVIKEFF